ncbi:hypothetical protein QBC35DRAFT_204542 [Podospora australis]|uniref:Uncharacterized protein n=1 Tax=Podospora australis TaxID=1536484 RepID=A0AAN6X2S5_9PEZI|nr:hypothetical protein QBC35DRAFT_204542 [Podospora australis]
MLTLASTSRLRAVKAIAASPTHPTRALSQPTMGFQEVKEWKERKSGKRTPERPTIFDLHISTPTHKSTNIWNISYRPDEFEISERAALIDRWNRLRSPPTPSSALRGNILTIRRDGSGKKSFHKDAADRSNSQSTLVLNYTPVNMEDVESNETSLETSVAVLNKLCALSKRRAEELKILISIADAEQDFRRHQESLKAAEEKEKTESEAKDGEELPLPMSLPIFLGGGPF